MGNILRVVDRGAERLPIPVPEIGLDLNEVVFRQFAVLVCLYGSITICLTD